MLRVFFLLIILLSGCRAAQIADVARKGVISESRHDSDEKKDAEDKIVQTTFSPSPESSTTDDKSSPKAGYAAFVDPETEPSAVEKSFPLTLAMLEGIALGSNPTIPQAAALVQQQEGLTVQAGLYPNPQAGYIRSDADQSGQSQTSGVFLSQEIVTAKKLQLAQRASQQDVELRAWQLDAQKQRVRNDLHIRFYEVLGAQEAVAAAKEIERSASDEVRIAQELIEARRAGRPDLLQAEMQLSMVQGVLKDAEFRLQAGRRQLANLAGIVELPTSDLVGSLEDDIPELEWESSLQLLLDCSPLLKSQEAELQAATTEVQMSRAQAVPNVSVQVVAQRDHVQKYSSVSTLVALPVPVFNRNQGNIAHAEAFLAQQQREYERLRWALSDQLATSFRQYSTLHSEAMRLRDEILPRAAEYLDLTSEAYRQGRMDFSRLVEARETYFHARMTQIDTLTELHKVVTEIEGLQLTGGLNPTEIGTALQTISGLPGSGARSVLLQQLQSQQNSINRNLPGAVQASDR